MWEYGNFLKYSLSYLKILIIINGWILEVNYSVYTLEITFIAFFFFLMLTRPGFIKLFFLLWWLKILLLLPTDPGVGFLSLLCGSPGYQGLQRKQGLKFGFYQLGEESPRDSRMVWVVICYLVWGWIRVLTVTISVTLEKPSHVSEYPFLTYKWGWNAVRIISRLYSHSCGQWTANPQG